MFACMCAHFSFFHDYSIHACGRLCWLHISAAIILSICQFPHYIVKHCKNTSNLTRFAHLAFLQPGLLFRLSIATALSLSLFLSRSHTQSFCATHFTMQCALFSTIVCIIRVIVYKDLDSVFFPYSPLNH